MTEPNDAPARVLTDAERAERALRNKTMPLPAGGRRVPVVLTEPPDPRKA